MNYQKVKIISQTQPTTLTDKALSIEEYIIYCARVSNPKNQNNVNTSQKLLQYLMDNKHWSPFEMAHVTISIETTLDIIQQILRHKSFSFQQFSQRYAKVNNSQFITNKECRLQDTKNRQNSLETSTTEQKKLWKELQIAQTSVAINMYQDALKAGIAKEVARSLLPSGLTISNLYMSGSIRSWIHYIDLRTHAHTQKEHRDIANKCNQVLNNIMPNIFKLKELV